MLRLFFNGYGLAAFIKFDDTKTLRIINIIAKDSRARRLAGSFDKVRRKTRTIKDIIA